MERGVLETLLGAIVLVVALGFAAMLFSSRTDNLSASYGLDVYFDSAQGLKLQTDVRLGGVPVGYVDSITLDPHTLQAVVRIVVDANIALPKETQAEITTAGLLGDAFLKLISAKVDAEAEMLADGDAIRKTVSPVSLEDLLGQAVFALTQE